MRAAGKHLPEGGRIVPSGSGIATRVAYLGLAGYAASKAAVVGYTKGWARDLGPRGITVNVVQPGPIDTDMNPDSEDLAAVQKAGTAGEHHSSRSAIPNGDTMTFRKCRARLERNTREHQARDGEG